MGKAQSKRSVDITTETKKGNEDEITEKMEKIEDLDKKEVVNGDATIPEQNDLEKKDIEDVENDKDMTTEKDIDVQASGDAAEHQNIAETSKDDGGSAAAEEISPLADENIKKSKKEKVKKKWSFRSISFGKKDKQKPAKNEDVAEDGSAATNGADTEEKKINELEDTQKDKSENEKEEKTTENHENGIATPHEVNGDELNEEKTSDEKSIDITANTTNNTISTETFLSVQKETAAVSSELSEKTENTAVTNETKIFENATVDDALKNGNGVDEKMKATEQEPLKTDVTNASLEASSEKTSTLGSAVTNLSSASTNGEVVDQIHQNGDHGESELEVIEKSKAQIEVNFNTDNKVSAATLDYISITSTNPSNVQIHVQDLNASSEKPDEIIQIISDESVVKKPTDIDISSCTADHSSLSEIVSLVDVESKVQIETTVSDLTSETVDNEKVLEEKLGVDLYPPPLPISPPPSQVSVFAFTNSDGSVEDTIQTKNCEPAINNLNQEIEKELAQPLCGYDMREILHSQNASTISSGKIAEQLTSHDQLVPLIFGVASNANVNGQCQENNEVEEASVCKELNKDHEVPSFGLSEDSIIEEEEPSVDVVAAVINEITETAAEIVNQQLIFKERITDGQSSQNNEERREDESINENIVVECTNKKQNDEDHVGCLELECEIANSSNKSPLVPEQTNIITSECSLDFTASVSIQQDQDEMVFLKKSENIREEHLDPIKEFATAKDIKDNVTVAEITQDLSVTCE